MIELIQKINKAKVQAKKVADEMNLALINQSLVECTELLEEMGTYKSALTIELNDIKEQKNKEVSELIKTLNDLKNNYSDVINTKKNALITISSEFSSLKALLALLKISGSNAKNLG